MERLTWEEFFINQTLLVALRSPDPSTKCGAIIVSPDNRVIASGYNGLPRGMSNDIDWENKDLKLGYIVHAELNALLNCQESVRGCTMYVNWHPCHECAKAIIQSGIQRLCYLKSTQSYGRWESSFALSAQMLVTCGVEVVAVEAANYYMPIVRAGQVYDLNGREPK